MTILIDTNVLLAATIRKDARHVEAAQLLRYLGREPQIVVQPVLNEFFQIIAMCLHYRRAIESLERARAAFQIEPLTDIDFDRMVSIMREYTDSEFDYVDTAIMAVAERMNIQRICTFDLRDFRVFRPRHCEYFQLLP